LARALPLSTWDEVAGCKWLGAVSFDIDVPVFSSDSDSSACVKGKPNFDQLLMS
jgi:hypothetical protein